MTYSVKGVQYVAILVGWGGVWDVSGGNLVSKTGMTRNISRLLVFKIGGSAKLPPAPPEDKRVLDPPPFTGKPEQTLDGESHYAASCFVCHGNAAVSGALNPDLRHSATLNDPKLWQQIVHDGLLKDNGMAAWADQYSPDQIENIRQYVIKRANQDKALEVKK